MQTSFFPVIFAAVAILILGMINLLLLRFLNKVWWKNRTIRRGSYLLGIVGLVCIGVWGIAEYNGWKWVGLPFVLTVGLIFVFQVALLLSLPISGILHAINSLWDRFVKHRPPHKEKVDETRRRLIQSAAAAVPIAALALGAGGKVAAFTPAVVEKKPIKINNLPPSLVGLKILHLSDLHLRTYVTLDDLEPLLERVREYSPDLVLVTGDTADDLSQLPDAIRMIDQLKPRYGCFASLGNHEYFRGVKEARRIFDAGPIPLFVNQGTHIKVGDNSLLVAAIDDPRSMSQIDENFFPRTIETATKDRTQDDFVILMSHRPHAFDEATKRQIPLTLAGHTHGGQIGLFGRSIFEPMAPEAYLWGEYRKENSVLYTTSGAGHWFPFRLGCPTEALILELART